MKLQQKKRGFTLIELILYVALVSLLLVALSGVVGMVLSARVKGQSIAEVEQQGLQAMHRITDTLRNAQGVTSPGAGASASSVTVDVLTIANDPTIFNLSSGILQMQEGTTPAVALTNSRVVVSSLTFQNLSQPSTPGSVRIQFTVTYNNNTGRAEYAVSKTFVGTASLRHP